MKQTDIQKVLEAALAAGDLSSACASRVDAASATAAVSPSVSNTGGETPNLPLEAPPVPKSAMVDYLRFTCHDESMIEWAKMAYGGDADNWQEVEAGRHFYQRSLHCGAIRIYTHGTQEGMGFCVELSGQACREVEAQPWWNCWETHFHALLREEKFSITRLDVALDDRTGALDLELMAREAEAGNYSCRSGSLSIIRSKRRGKEGVGTTINFGKRDSGTRVLRCYDKLAEQIAKKKPVQGDFWVRVELECLNERAQLLARKLSATSGIADEAKLAVVCGAIREFVDFKNMDTVSDRAHLYRGETASWWLRFLSGWEKVRLTLAPLVRTIEKARNWLETQAAPTIAMIYDAYAGKGKTFLADLVQQGHRRMRPRHHAMAQAERRRVRVLLEATGPTGF